VDDVPHILFETSLYGGRKRQYFDGLRQYLQTCLIVIIILIIIYSHSINPSLQGSLQVKEDREFLVFMREYGHWHESELSPNLEVFVSYAGVLGQGVCYSRMVWNKDYRGK
jgi:hypothetical protein